MTLRLCAPLCSALCSGWHTLNLRSVKSSRRRCLKKFCGPMMSFLRETSQVRDRPYSMKLEPIEPTKKLYPRNWFNMVWHGFTQFFTWFNKVSLTFLGGFKCMMLSAKPLWQPAIGKSKFREPHVSELVNAGIVVDLSCVSHFKMSQRLQVVCTFKNLKKLKRSFSSGWGRNGKFNAKTTWVCHFGF